MIRLKIYGRQIILAAQSRNFFNRFNSVKVTVLQLYF